MQLVAGTFRIANVIALRALTSFRVEVFLDYTVFMNHTSVYFTCYHIIRASSGMSSIGLVYRKHVTDSVTVQFFVDGSASFKCVQEISLDMDPQDQT